MITDTTAPALPEALDAALRRMRLPYLRQAAPDVLATARAQRWDPAEVVRVLLAEEIADAAIARAKARLYQAPSGARYLQDMMTKVPDTVPEEERIWFALAAYNMGYAHMLDARTLTAKTKGNPDSWADVKQRLPLLSQKNYYSRLKYGFARGHEAYAYVENIRKYHISLVGYLAEKEKKDAQLAALGEHYPAVMPDELSKEELYARSFFNFRTETRVDNARLKIPTIGH